jgi:hypothetical protein
MKEKIKRGGMGLAPSVVGKGARGIGLVGEIWSNSNFLKFLILRLFSDTWENN